MASNRLSADKQFVEQLAQDMIPNHDMLHIKTMNSGQTTVYMLAMTLGVHEGQMTPSKSKKELIQSTSLHTMDYSEAFIDSLAIDELSRTGDEKDFSNQEKAYGIAEKYANTGFQQIQDMVGDWGKYDNDFFAAKMISIMDDVFDEIMVDSNEYGRGIQIDNGMGN